MFGTFRTISAAFIDPHKDQIGSPTNQPFDIMQKDHFTSLPPEIIQNIISYLLVTHDPPRAWRHTSRPTNVPTSARQHDLATLATTCRVLHNQVNQWSAHFLHQHSSILATSDAAWTQYMKKHPFAGLKDWITKHCAFCGKKSQRRAILMNGLRCCALCDKAHWPDKITLSEARKEFNLKTEHLLPSVYQDGGWSDFLPGPWYGTYKIGPMTTTMFDRKGVRKQARRVHGPDVDAYLLKRKKAREDKKKKQ